MNLIKTDADNTFLNLITFSTLMSGFTTVRDLGGTGVNVSIFLEMQSTERSGPRVN
jgi:hypothetical protein